MTTEKEANELDRQKRDVRLNSQKVDIPPDMTDPKAIKALVEDTHDDGLYAVDIFACGHFYVSPMGHRCEAEVHTVVCEACRGD